MDWIYIELVLMTVSIVLGAIALLILCYYKRKYQSEIQQSFLISLILIETCIGVLGIVGRVLQIFLMKNDSIFIFQSTGLTFIYYIAMIMLTLDHFYQVYLNIKYPLFWNVKKTYF